MTTINETLEPYIKILHALGETPGIGRIRLLEYILSKGNGAEIQAPQMAKEVNTHRTEVYKTLKYFEKIGFIYKKEKTLLPLDIQDWGVGRRRSWKKREGYSRSATYVIDISGAINTIDNRIKELETIKETLTKDGGEK